MIQVLFVCLGNICRSPAAEGVMKKMIEDRGFQNKISCDSAGTSGFHHGHHADSRMHETASQRGYQLTSRSRKFTVDDFQRFDYILTMDNQNYKDVMKGVTKDVMKNITKDIMDDSPMKKVLGKKEHGEKDQTLEDKVYKFVDFCQAHNISEVPDPYYKEDEGFQFVMDLLEDGCKNLLDKIVKENQW